MGVKPTKITYPSDEGTFRNPKDIIWEIRLRPDFMDYFLFIGSYYEREFHLWVHNEEYLKDDTGKLERKTEEFLKGAL